MFRGVEIGQPETRPHLPSLLKETVELAAKWANPQAEGYEIPGVETWFPPLWVLFLKTLGGQPENVSVKALETLRTTYKMDEQTHPAIREAWYELVAKTRFKPSYPGLERFFDGSIGRAKYVVPLAGALKVGGDMEFATRVYGALRPKISKMTRDWADGAFGWKEPSPVVK